ncbi:MAG: hypothetical protein K6E59_00140 [Bacilli bacterium]|nr:hypothetical protein [Bacilli bacterium]
MRIAVIYQSKTGNTRLVAEAIAKELHTCAWDIEEVKDLDCDLLVLGAGVYAARLDKKMRLFLASLEGTSARRAALFGTSAGGRKPFGMMAAVLKKKGIPVDKDYFYCPGKWWKLHTDRPNEQDLEDARAWAKGLLEE